MARAASLTWVATLWLAAGCGSQSPPPADEAPEPNVIASVINVTPFEATIVLSGVRGDSVDTVERTIDSIASTDVTFVCLDELVVGDPIEPAEPGLVVELEDGPLAIDPFAVIAGESFVCGDIVEFIISGTDADTLSVDVFSFTPP